MVGNTNGHRYPARLEGGALMRKGAQVTLQNVMATLKAERKLLPGNIVAAVGALGGFAAQIGVRETLVDTGERTEDEVFQVLTFPTGERWFSGPQVNAPLADGKLSIWDLASHVATKLGATDLPDLGEMSRRQTALMRAANYGQAAVDRKYAPDLDMVSWLRANWERFRVQAERYCEEPIEKPIFFGYVAQEALEHVNDAMPPEVALRVLMESAIAWSRLDPRRLGEPADPAGEGGRIEGV